MQPITELFIAKWSVPCAEPHLFGRGVSLPDIQGVSFLALPPDCSMRLFVCFCCINFSRGTDDDRLTNSPQVQVSETMSLLGLLRGVCEWPPNSCNAKEMRTSLWSHMQDSPFS